MSILRRVLPLTRAGLALWAWRNRDEIGQWLGFAGRSVNNVRGGGSTSDVVAEGRLRAALTANATVRGTALTVEVKDGVAILRGKVDEEVAMAALAAAEKLSAVRSVRDETQRPTSSRWRS